MIVPRHGGPRNVPLSRYLMHQPPDVLQVAQQVKQHPDGLRDGSSARHSPRASGPTSSARLSACRPATTQVRKLSYRARSHDVSSSPSGMYRSRQRLKWTWLPVSTGTSRRE